MEKDLEEEKQRGCLEGSIRFWGETATQKMAPEMAPPLLVLWEALSAAAQNTWIREHEVVLDWSRWMRAHFGECRGSPAAEGMVC